MSVSLKAGGNYVVYTGRAQSASDAFTSIMSYLDPAEVIYYWNNLTGLYELVITTTTMVPYGVYWIEVTQNCTWTYGAEATAPSSVQLYAGINLVAYLGPTQDVETAIASILPYFEKVSYYIAGDGGEWIFYAPGVPSDLHTMVNREAYFISVTQNCLWTYVAPELVPCEITITAPNSAAEGEAVNASVTIKNVSPYHYSYKATIYAVPDLYPDYVIGEIDQVITSGSSVTLDTPFTMPDCNVTVFVRVERWAFDRWVYDNSASRIISLEVPATYHLDVYVPPWAAGGYVEPGSGDYPAYSTVTLTARPLSGYQFTGWGGDASGTSPTYNLYMDSDKYVEAYFEPVPVPEYRGTISKKELEYNETRSIIPVY